MQSLQIIQQLNAAPVAQFAVAALALPWLAVVLMYALGGRYGVAAAGAVPGNARAGLKSAKPGKTSATRKSQFRIIAAAGALLLAAPLTASAFFESGSGVPKTETRAVGNFTRIEVSGATVLEVTAGQSATTLTVSGDDNIVPLVKTEVSGSTLSIGTEGIHNTKLPLVVKIGLPKLVAIEASGATKITASNLSGEHFELEGSGATKAVLTGAVDRLMVNVSGAGHVEAAGLAAKMADIDTSGAGNVQVNASDKLKVSISGAGKVTYTGNPVITQHISGAGKIASAK
jgi:hypothetical protein